MKEGISKPLTDRKQTMTKLFATLIAAAFVSTGAFAADAKKDEKAVAAAPAASKADAAKKDDKKAAAPAPAASAKK